MGDSEAVVTRCTSSSAYGDFIANTGVGDMDAIISLKKNGSIVVPDFANATLRAAVEQVIGYQKANTVNIRENSREFALEEGVARYAAVYQELLNE